MKRFSILASVLTHTLLTACSGTGGPDSGGKPQQADAGKPSSSKSTATDRDSDDPSEAGQPGDEATTDGVSRDASTPEPTATTSTVPSASSTAADTDDSTPDIGGLLPGMLIPSDSVDGGAMDNVAASLQQAQQAVFRIEATGTYANLLSQENTTVAGGTGFVIDAEGYAVTNAHVVSGATLLRVQFPGDDEQHNARVVALSECSDLALLKLEGRTEFPYLAWSQTAAELGLDVKSLGYPLGGELTLTEGIVSKQSTSANSEWASVDDVIEHTATINPGNSGGPLLTSQYHVLGINYAGNDYNQYFAIGRDEGQRIIGELRQGHDIESIGINGIAAGDSSLSGIWVYSVKAGSPADGAGVRPGDLITHFGGIPLLPNAAGRMTMEDYCDILRSHSADAAIDVRAIRFETLTLWEGQINGRKLQQVEPTDMTPTGTTTTAPTPSTAPTTRPTVAPEPAPTPSTQTIKHSELSIRFDVPGTWTDSQSFMSERFDGELGHMLVAAPEVDAFLGKFSASGVSLAVWPAPETLPDGGIEEAVDVDEILDEYSAFTRCSAHSERVNSSAGSATIAIEEHAECDDNDVLVIDVALELSDQYSAWLRLHAFSDEDYAVLELVLDTLVVDPTRLP